MSKASKAFKRVSRQRNKEYVPPVNPETSYKRQFHKTEMGTFWTLIYNKRYDALLMLILTYALIAVALAAGVLLLANFISSNYFGVNLW